MSANHIHPTAIISPGATIAPDVIIGPYCVIGADVTIGAGSELKSHVCIDGLTTIGEHNVIYPFASLGSAPQDLKFGGEKSKLIIGDHNTIREHVTMNTGTEGGGMVTRVGNHGLFMTACHVAHDCQVGDHVILANNAAIAGHVVLENHVIMGGLSAAHQFVRIGEHAMIGGMSAVEHDVIPFGSVMGDRAGLAGLNLIGLKRRGFDRETIHALRGVYKAVFESREGTLSERLEAAVKPYENVEAVQQIVRFIAAESQRQLCVPNAPHPRHEAA